MFGWEEEMKDSICCCLSCVLVIPLDSLVGSTLKNGSPHSGEISEDPRWGLFLPNAQYLCPCASVCACACACLAALTTTQG